MVKKVLFAIVSTEKQIKTLLKQAETKTGIIQEIVYSSKKPTRSSADSLLKHHLENKIKQGLINTLFISSAVPIEIAKMLVVLIRISGYTNDKLKIIFVTDENIQESGSFQIDELCRTSNMVGCIKSFSPQMVVPS